MERIAGLDPNYNQIFIWKLSTKKGSQKYKCAEPLKRITKRICYLLSAKKEVLYNNG